LVGSAFRLCAWGNLDDGEVYTHEFSPHSPSIYACNLYSGKDDPGIGHGQKIFHILGISPQLALISKGEPFHFARHSNQIYYIMYSTLYLNIIQNFRSHADERNSSTKKLSRKSLLFVVHFSVKDYPLPKALAVLILYFQSAERAFPLLNDSIRQNGLASPMPAY